MYMKDPPSGRSRDGGRQGNQAVWHGASSPATTLSQLIGRMARTGGTACGYRNTTPNLGHFEYVLNYKLLAGRETPARRLRFNQESLQGTCGNASGIGWCAFCFIAVHLCFPHSHLVSAAGGEVRTLCPEHT